MQLTNMDLSQMTEFDTWEEARLHFHKYILPNNPINEDETVEIRFMDWVENTPIIIKEEKEKSNSDYYDLMTHN